MMDFAQHMNKNTSNFDQPMVTFVWSKLIREVGVEDLTFASTPKPFRFPDLTKTDWFHFINHFAQRPYHCRKISMSFMSFYLCQVNEEEFLRIMKKTNLFWGPGDSSQQHRQFFAKGSSGDTDFLGDSSSRPSSHVYSLSIHITYKTMIHENTFYIAILLGFFSQPRNLTPKIFLSQKFQDYSTCLLHLWVTPYLIFGWALFSDRCGCCFADLSRTPGVWINRSNGQCWFQMRTLAISEQKLLLQLQPIGS